MSTLKAPSTLLKSCALAVILVNGVVISHASSHREAPMITSLPKLDATDLYMFRSYEEERGDFVTILANYYPLQAPYGGPNYFDLETRGLYHIHIDNDGDSVQDLTFTFDFTTILAGIAVSVGDTDVPIPLVNIGVVGLDAEDTDAVNSRQEYTVTLTRHRDTPPEQGLGQSASRTEPQRPTNSSTREVRKIRHAETDATSFRKPLDNIGSKSIPDYQTYANNHIFPITIPECSEEGRVFVGQRRESFAVNLGQVFDLFNLDPLGAEDAVENPLRDNNITTLALEVPVSCLTEDDPVIGAWTTSSLSMGMGNRSPLQVSRLDFPLINEVVIGLPDKDIFNASHPVEDAQFVDYVLNPTLPFLLETLFEPAIAPAVPRNDLIQAVGGIPGLNTPLAIEDGTYPRSVMLRLNTSIAPVPAAQQMNMGVLDGDTAGFPNGRRPGDDVVDITLRVMMGALIDDPDVAPNNQAPFTDQVTVSAMDFQSQFPYLNEPLPGSEER